MEGKTALTDPIRIVVIDDSEADCALLDIDLRRGGIDAVCERVESADEMRRMLREKEYNIALCDYVLPGFSVEAALLIKEEEDPDLPFIVISGIVRTADVVEVLRSGADDFIEKDDLARLVPSVERALRNRQERAARRLAEEKLLQAQKMEAVGQLTGGITHDFNNLLTAVLGNLEIARKQVDDESETSELIDAAIRAGQRGSEMTKRLLAFARKQPLSPRPTDVNHLVSGMTELLQRTLGGHVKLGFVEDPDLWATVTDPVQLENAILNLAINARDAMPDGGVLTIETACKALDTHYAGRNPNVVPGPYVMVAISDTGHGMTSEVAERIFEPFFTTKETGGTGLGLSMVFSFIEQSKGHISVYSEPDQGTTFRLYLPKSDQEVRPEQDHAQKQEPSGGAETVLVVEDDEDVRHFVVTALAKLGYEVHDVADGRAALAFLENADKPDLLFTDMVMPNGITGFDIATEFSKRWPGIKTLMTSGFADDALHRMAPPDTGIPVLAKPYTLVELADQVRAVIDGG